MSHFTKERILKAFERMGEIAHDRGLQLEVSLYGGAVMLLVYDSRAITKDVDAVIAPHSEGLRIAAEVAAEFGFEADWLNSDVSQFLAPMGAKRPFAREFRGLQVNVPTASYLLALKAMASRRALPGYAGDEADLRFLLRKMNIRSVAGVQFHIDRYFPDDVLPDQHAALIQSILVDEGLYED